MAEGIVTGVAFSPDGETLAASYGGFDARSNVLGGVVLWDVGRRQRLADQPLAVAEGWVSSVAFSPDGKTLAVGFGFGSVVRNGAVLWDVGRRERLANQPLPVAEGRVGGVAFSPDGKTLAADYDIGGFQGGGVVLWDVGRRERLADQPLVMTEDDVASVAFSPDGSTLAVGYGRVSFGGGVVLWDVGRRERLGSGPLKVAESGVTSVAFSLDSKTLAAGYAFSPDGSVLARGYDTLGGGQGGVVLWDVGRRERLVAAPLPVPEGGVHSVAFSPDSKTLAASFSSGGNVGGVVLWDADLESWKRLAGRIANRNLTRAEWRHYFPGEEYRPTFDNLPVPPEENKSK